MVGIDEVGRGCWAGPLLVVAVTTDKQLPSLSDSKKITKNKHQALFEKLNKTCRYGEGWVQPAEIDKYGLSKSMQIGVKRALDAINCPSNEQIIMDGNINYCSEEFVNVKCVVKADSLHPIVSAASIIAKCKRDAFMYNLASDFPEYGFEGHVGYGTKQHRNALSKFGITSHHRKSFKPVNLLI